jgi:hypothetical protein
MLGKNIQRVDVNYNFPRVLHPDLVKENLDFALPKVRSFSLIVMIRFISL